MESTLKALIVVLTVAVAVFTITKPTCVRFMHAKDFVRRRNTWLFLTVVAFLSPNIWVYAVLTVTALAWSSAQEENPLALYAFVALAAPASVEIPIPIVGINSLFALDHARILALTVLVPAAWRTTLYGHTRMGKHVGLADSLLFGYLALNLVLLMPYESITHTMRRGFLFVLDVGVLYYIGSRSCPDRRSIEEVLAAIALSAVLMAPIAVFETLRGWLLYQEIAVNWGAPIPFAYLFREGALRAQASAGHAIALGNILAISFAIWAYFGTRAGGPLKRLLMAAILWAGLLAAYSRGPWIAAVLILLTYMFLDPRGLKSFFVCSASLSVVAIAVLVSPVGSDIVDNLPFVGTVAAETVTYREQLAIRSWELIKQNPVLGSPFVLLYMEELRQGQGIIDLINTYARVALFSGLVGLTLFVGFFLVALVPTLQTSRSIASVDAEGAHLGAILVACLIGFLWMMGIGGFGEAVERLGFVIAGLSVAYGRTVKSAEPRTPTSFRGEGRARFPSPLPPQGS